MDRTFDRRRCGGQSTLVSIYRHKTLRALWLLVGLTVSIAYLSFLCQLSVPWILRSLVNDVVALPTHSNSDFLSGCVALVLSSVGVVVCEIGQKCASAYLTQQATEELQGIAAQHMHRLPLAAFDHSSGSEISSIINVDIPKLASIWECYYAEVCLSVVCAATTIAVMARVYGGRGLLLLLVGPLQLAIAAKFSRPLEQCGRRVQEANSQLADRLATTVSALAEIRLCEQVQNESDYLRRLIKQVTRAKMRDTFISASSSLGFVAFWFVIASVLYAFRTVTSPAHIGSIAALVTYAAVVRDPFVRIARALNERSSCIGASSAVHDFLSMPCEGPQTSAGVASPAGRTRCRDLAVRDVTVLYGNQLALRTLSFTVRAGTLCAVAGTNGSGKSTLIKVLAGLISANGGHVAFGECCYPSEEVRRTTAVVMQNPFVFHASIADNIRFGRPNASWADIESVVEDSGLIPLVRRLPNGLETILGVQGATISGGEKKRLALARALIRKPTLLLLDELTSGVDRETEAILLQRLRSLTQSCTILVASHHLSVLSAADKVIVLDGGCLVGDGTYKDLIARNNDYSLICTAERSNRSQYEHVALEEDGYVKITQ